MIWNSRIYLGIGLKKKYRRIKWKIMHNIAQQGIYILRLPMDYAGNPEIIYSAVLLQKYYPADSFCIIGLANTKREALRLIEQITSEMYQKLNGIDYYSFFELEKPKAD